MSSATTIENCGKGSEVTLYYNTGTTATPVWVEHIGMIEDLDMNETDELSELSGRRSTRTVREYNEGETELSITGTQTFDSNYEGWVYLNAARNGGAPQDLLILSGPITTVGSYGWRGHMWNSDRTTRGPAQGALVSAVNLQPAAPCIVDHAEVRVVKIAVSGTAADFDPTLIF